MKWLHSLTKRYFLSMVFVTLLGFSGSAAVSLLVRFPQPAIHDEFSYLLAADTFASGRLTNPPHPLWEHFESFHIIQQPTYASKYPPGQGMMLALGQLIGGNPVVGVWLGISLACASIYWMLRGWTTPRWALLGGILSALNFGFFGYWAQNYWGGAVAVLGGALFFGSTRRMLRRISVFQAIILGMGLLILANSRPLEGLVVFLLTVGFLWRSKDLKTFYALKVFVPLCMVLTIGGVWMGYYNYRTTGNWLRMPYQEYESTYSYAPIFLWRHCKEVPARCQGVFRKQQDDILGTVNYQRTFHGFLKSRGIAFGAIVEFFVRMIFVVPLIVLLLAWRKPNKWVTLACFVSGSIVLLVLTGWMAMPRKVAPVACLVVFLVVQGLRLLSTDHWKRKPYGAALAFGLVSLTVVSVAVSFHPIFRAPAWAQSRARAELMHELTKSKGQHLIIVRYSQNHWAHFDWVYNKADIDKAKVVWARDLGDRKNQDLVSYFKDRKIWLFDEQEWLNKGDIELRPYNSNTIRGP